MKRMKHPQHGWHHALDANEEARMRENGWEDDEPERKEEKPRRGRPPLNKAEEIKPENTEAQDTEAEE